MSRSSRQSSKRDHKIASLQEKLRRLEFHWTNGYNGIPMDAFNSDEIYKHHIYRLKKVYTEHELPQEMNYKHFKFPVMTRPNPLTQLYGTNGLLRLSPRSLEKDDKIRELGWDSRVTAAEAMLVSESRRKERPEESLSDSRRRMSSPLPSSTPSPPRARISHRNDEIKGSSSGSRSIEVKSHRCTDAKISEDGLIVEGMYRLNEDEGEIYSRFAEMLSNFDRYDMLNILNDVFRDAQTASQLSHFGGFEVNS